MKMKPRATVIMISAAMATASMSAMAASSYADQVSGSNFGTSNNSSNNTSNTSSAFSGGVPAQATAQEAVNAAGLPSQSVINTTRPYQDINTQDVMFGEQLFRGAFSTTSGSTFNDSYVINPGDNVQVRMWGAYQYAATMTVDPQGNIFLPNVGPVRISGVQNGNLQNVVKSAVNNIYRSNVGVYASLEEAQPVKVFVTGFVKQPGYYGGLAADSVLSYLDRAGGVDPGRGSYIDIQIKRNGQILQQVNLYDFLLAGQLEAFSFRDGDVITVAPQKKTFDISGEVQNEYTFEFDVNDLNIGDVLQVANPAANATNVSITRSAGRAQTAEYYSLSEAQNISVYNGDQMVVTSESLSRYYCCAGTGCAYW